MIKIQLVTPERVLQELSGQEVLLPTVDGQIGVRTGHQPLIAVLKAGEVVVKQENGTEELYAVDGGFVEVIQDQVRILADGADHADDLSEHQINEAIQRAQTAKSEAKEAHEFDDATALLEANLARLRVIKRKKARGQVRLGR